MTTKLHFKMALSSTEAARYYQGEAQYVVVRADNGQTIRFPASHIRPFIDQLGVRGYFSIEFDGNNKLLAIKKVRDN